MNWLLKKLALYLFWNVTLFHHGKGGQQKVAEQQTGQDIGQANQATTGAQSTYGQFEGPVQNSPFYKALLTSGIESTSNAYDKARSNARARANQAGFGYNQPVEQGSENELGAREASDLARVPMTAMTEAAPLSMEAAGGSSRLGLGLGGEALGWNEQAANLNRSRAGLWNQIFGSGQGAAQGAGAAMLMAGA